MKIGAMATIFRRSEVQWSLVPVLAALGLSFVPGFGVLSFYFCLPIGLVLAMAAGSVVITSIFHERTRGGSPSRGAWRGVAHAALLPAGPLAVITVAHFVNGPCDYLFGLGHYAAGPMVSTLCGAAAATACSLAIRNERRASAAFIIIFVASFLPNAWTMYFGPSVMFYNPFLGMYPGPIYDELIEVTPAFIAFRIWCLAAGGSLVLAIWAVFDGGAGWNGTRALFRRFRLWAPSLALLVAAGLVWEGAGDFDFTLGRDAIRRELTVTRTDHGCTVLADRSFAGDPTNVDLLLRDCSYRHERMAAFFGVPASPRVTVYLYRDADQKARLTGARWVEISKPWLNEIHVTDMKPGDMVLGHEIAHVAAGRLARNWLAMPLDAGLIPDMGMVEGLAVAGAFADDGPSPHEWAAAMIAAGMDPGVKDLFSPLSFVSGGAAASYNTAGSFIRYIRDTFGGDALAVLAAGGSFEDATGLGIDELAGRWKKFLADVFPDAADESMKLRAAARFSDPGVLHRRCPLDVSRCLRDAMKAWDGGNVTSAIDGVLRAAGTDAGDRGLKRLAARMTFLAGTVRADEVSSAVEDVMRPPDGAATMADRTAAADLMVIWALGQPSDSLSAGYLERARGELRDIRAMLTPGSAMRSVCARLRALESPPTAGLAMISALSDPRPFNEGDAGELERIAGSYPDIAELQYLAGRAAMADGNWNSASRLFARAAEAGFREPAGLGDGMAAGTCAADFAAEDWKNLGISAYWSGHPGAAAPALVRARPLARFEGDRMLIDEYLERISGR